MWGGCTFSVYQCWLLLQCSSFFLLVLQKSRLKKQYLGAAETVCSKIKCNWNVNEERRGEEILRSVKWPNQEIKSDFSFWNLTVFNTHISIEPPGERSIWDFLGTITSAHAHMQISVGTNTFSRRLNTTRSAILKKDTEMEGWGPGPSPGVCLLSLPWSDRKQEAETKDGRACWESSAAA